MDPTTGLACHEIDILRAKCQGYGSPNMPAMSVRDSIASVKAKQTEFWNEAQKAPTDEQGVLYLTNLISWFVMQVQSGGAWALKSQYGSEFESAGNWHFGVVGFATFNSETFIRFGAGAQQAKTDLGLVVRGDARLGQGIPGLPPTFGDSFRDQGRISQGFRWMSEGCNVLR